MSNIIELNIAEIDSVVGGVAGLPAMPTPTIQTGTLQTATFQQSSVINRDPALVQPNRTMAATMRYS
ncbi:MAG: hypothetical protein U1E60_15310 [Reyranellaceae bacterium]